VPKPNMNGWSQDQIRGAGLDCCAFAAEKGTRAHNSQQHAMSRDRPGFLGIEAHLRVRIRLGMATLLDGLSVGPLAGASCAGAGRCRARIQYNRKELLNRRGNHGELLALCHAPDEEHAEQVAEQPPPRHASHAQVRRRPAGRGRCRFAGRSGPRRRRRRIQRQTAGSVRVQPEAHRDTRGRQGCHRLCIKRPLRCHGGHRERPGPDHPPPGQAAATRSA
jgi:hypothetical protein